MIGGRFVSIPFLNIHRHKGTKLKCAPFFFFFDYEETLPRYGPVGRVN